LCERLPGGGKCQNADPLHQAQSRLRSDLHNGGKADVERFRGISKYLPLLR
jgi:hypothetical protein